MKIMKILSDMFTYLCIVAVGFCTWIGAEYLIYEEVSLNYVDMVIGLILAWYIFQTVRVISHKTNYSPKR